MNQKPLLSTFIIAAIAAAAGFAAAQTSALQGLETQWLVSGALFVGVMLGGLLSRVPAGATQARGRDNAPNRKTLYVGNMPFSTTEAELRDTFASHGKVHSIKMLTDRHTGRPRGVGFVEMDPRGAQAAMTALNGTDFGGRNIKVNEAGPGRGRQKHHHQRRHYRR